MDRPFLDANVLFSAAYLPGSGLAALWTLTNTELLSSPLAIQEAHVNLARIRPARLPDLASRIAAIRIVSDPPAGAALPSGIVLPPNDGTLFLAALSAGATHFLTGDKRHFGPYFGQTIGGVLILRPAAYLASRLTAP